MNSAGEEHPLRVLHCPETVGGHAPQLARAERALGIASVSVALQASPYGYAADETYAGGRIGREAKRLSLLWRALRDFDVIHFNYGSSLFPGPLATSFYRSVLCMRDLPLLKKAGKAIFVTYQGDDARQGDYCRRYFDVHYAREVGPEYYPAGSDDRKREAIARFSAYADGIYALNPDLLYVLPPSARFLPYASIDPETWRPAPCGRSSGPLVVVHAPSHRIVKGTRYLTDAVSRLAAEGLPIELRLVENITRVEARAIYQSADVVVDQLLAGWYGGLALEAMALGKPVVAYVRQEDLKHVPPDMQHELPIVNANPANVADVLRSLATLRRSVLPDLGRQGRLFVEKWHDPLKVAATVVRDYRAVHARRALSAA